MRSLADYLAGALLIASPAVAQVSWPAKPAPEPLAAAAEQAQRQLRQTFTNLQFDELVRRR